MAVGQAFKAGHRLVHPRVVLHGAGPQRVHAQINGAVPGGKAGEVADDFDFADLGMWPRSARSAPPSSSAASTSGTSSGGSFHAAFPGEDFSKISPSFWLTWRVAFLTWLTAPPPVPVQGGVCPPFPPAPARRPPHPWKRGWWSRCSTTKRRCPVRDRTSSAENRRQCSPPAGGC